MTPKIYIQENHLAIEDISCIGADGAIFERHDRIYAARNPASHKIKSDHDVDLYTTILYCEQLDRRANTVLPSSALNFKILTTVFPEAVEKQPDGSYKTKDPRLREYLDLFCHYRASSGAQNTLPNVATGKVIHYPTIMDFLNLPRFSFPSATFPPINEEQSRVELDIGDEKDSLEMVLVADILFPGAQYMSESFGKQLTGLEDPTALLELLDYFTMMQNPASQEALFQNSPFWSRGTDVRWALLSGYLSEMFVRDAADENIMPDSVRAVQKVL